MKILVTGAAGFIGFHVTKKLVEKGHTVVGLDNINAYYDINLKFGRLEQLGISIKVAQTFFQKIQSITYPHFQFVRMPLEDKENLENLFNKEKFDVVCNLAAQAGVRYSLVNPSAYIDSNIVGFLNILECCRNNGVKHLVYASSSSVYGANTKIPFESSDPVDQPLSLYAASKKSNELMAHTYSHLYGLAATGLRFFTVYGPWGRPDMAVFLFTDAIMHGKSIKIFNYGNMERDFTYIDDIVEGVIRIIEQPVDHKNTDSLYRIYNIGNSKPVKLLDFVEALENSLNLKAEKEFLPMQPGDVEKTWADVSGLVKDFGYNPNTPIEKGVQKFVQWYKDFYNTPKN